MNCEAAHFSLSLSPQIVFSAVIVTYMSRADGSSLVQLGIGHVDTQTLRPAAVKQDLTGLSQPVETATEKRKVHCVCVGMYKNIPNIGRHCNSQRFYRAVNRSTSEEVRVAVQDYLTVRARKVKVLFLNHKAVIDWLITGNRGC